MKNRTVEAMVRVQFNIPDDVKVRVEALGSCGNSWDFEVEWWGDDDTRYQSNFTLPQIYVREDTTFKIQ